MNPQQKDLGVGVGLRSAHHAEFLNSHIQSVNWVEVTTENFMPWENGYWNESIETLLKIRKDRPVALHGVSMNLGSSDPINGSYLKRLKSLMDKLEPFIVSDHLSWTGVNGFNLHDLLPIPYTQQALNRIVRKIGEVQDFLGRSILIENPSSYFEFQKSEMTETEFINQVVQKSGCGLLLDLNNVYVSSVNHQWDPIQYLEKINFSKVYQIHLAGHSNENGFLIDTHDQNVSEPVWKLYEWVLQKYGYIITMIERDGRIPPWNELELEIKKMGVMYEKHRQRSKSASVADSRIDFK